MRAFMSVMVPARNRIHATAFNTWVERVPASCGQGLGAHRGPAGDGKGGTQGSQRPIQGGGPSDVTKKNTKCWFNLNFIF